MEELDDDTPKDITYKLTEALPFMSVFPFGDYDIMMEEKGSDYLKLGISPLLINEIGVTGKTEGVSFYYYDEDSRVSISIGKEDIEWIARNAEHVKKFDALRKSLDAALKSESIIDKAKSIKLGKKLVKELDCEYLMEIDFTQILKEFLNLEDVTVSSKIKLGLQKLSEATLKAAEFSEKQFSAITAFLNFQIHYCRIILGVVIASKIY